MSRRFAALAGQLRAVATLAPAAGVGGGLRSRRPQRRTNRPLERLRSDLALIHANATLDSPAGRHALRLAVVVPAATLIARELPLSRDYWMVVAAATVLRPEFGSTFTRGTERALGTSLGVALAGAIAALLHPAGAATVVLVGLLAWAGYALFPASFAVGFAFITALVVFLLNAISPDTLSTASARLLDTFVGGAIGLIAYALWPTWSRSSARRELAAVVAAQRAYIATVCNAVISGRRAPDEERTRARAARRARTQAEAVIAQSLSDPATRRINAGWSQGVLAAMRRLIQGAHVLRLEVAESRHARPVPALQPLADDLDTMLTMVQQRLEQDGRPPAHPDTTPDLRGRFAEFERASGGDPGGAELVTDIDEIVDAANGLAALVGLDPGEAGDPGQSAD